MGEKPPLPSFPSESIDGRVKDSSLIDVGRAAEGGGWRLASVPFLVTSIPVTFRVSHVDQSQRCGKCNSLSNVRPADRQAGGEGEAGQPLSPLPSPLFHALLGRRCCLPRPNAGIKGDGTRISLARSRNADFFCFNSREMNSTVEMILFPFLAFFALVFVFEFLNL